MDNITHSLVGAVLGQTGLKRRTRKGMAALVLGANGPDIDVFFGWVPWLPLATHRGFTHGIIGAFIVMPLIVAGFLWGLDRWQSHRGEVFAGKPELSWNWLLALALIGGATHPVLDLQTTYAVQLLSPFSTRWFHTDTLFIIDLFLLLLLGMSFWVSRLRERRDGRWMAPARAALAVMIAYIGLNQALTTHAEARLTDAIGRTPERIVASPPPVKFWLREMAWLANGRYGWARANPLTGDVTLAGSKPMGFDDPLVRRAIGLSPEVQRFLRWSIMAHASVKRERCFATVTFNDARYSNSLRPSGFEHVVRVPTCP